MNANDIQDIRNLIGFRAFDASNIMPLQMAKVVKICPIFNEDKTKVQYPTYQEHFKFGFNEERVGRDEDKTYRYILMCLKLFCGIPKEMLETSPYYEKVGSLMFYDNQYNTNVRIWTTKKIGKILVCEVTVSGYKNAIWVDVKK